MKYLKSEYEIDRFKGTLQTVVFNEISVTDKGKIIVDLF